MVTIQIVCMLWNSWNFSTRFSHIFVFYFEIVWNIRWFYWFVKFAIESMSLNTPQNASFLISWKLGCIMVGWLTHRMNRMLLLLENAAIISWWRKSLNRRLQTRSPYREKVSCSVFTFLKILFLSFFSVFRHFFLWSALLLFYIYKLDFPSWKTVNTINIIFFSFFCNSE